MLYSDLCSARFWIELNCFRAKTMTWFHKMRNANVCSILAAQEESRTWPFSPRLHQHHHNDEMQDCTASLVSLAKQIFCTKTYPFRSKWYNMNILCILFFSFRFFGFHVADFGISLKFIIHFKSIINFSARISEAPTFNFLIDTEILKKHDVM